MDLDREKRLWPKSVRNLAVVACCLASVACAATRKERGATCLDRLSPAERDARISTWVGHRLPDAPPEEAFTIVPSFPSVAARPETASSLPEGLWRWGRREYELLLAWKELKKEPDFPAAFADATWEVVERAGAFADFGDARQVIGDVFCRKGIFERLAAKAAQMGHEPIDGEVPEALLTADYRAALAEPFFRAPAGPSLPDACAATFHYCGGGLTVTNHRDGCSTAHFDLMKADPDYRERFNGVVKKLYPAVAAVKKDFRRRDPAFWRHMATLTTDFQTALADQGLLEKVARRRAAEGK
ncbi:MAG: hypothetical protein LAO51_07405 [Acidobacteriia bacterium]|nr:hypothetical protein [Terriglobia bacterium]